METGSNPPSQTGKDGVTNEAGMAFDGEAFAMPPKKSILPKVIIGLLIVAIVLVGTLLAVQYFNREQAAVSGNTELPAGASPSDMIAITEDEDGNISATDGYGNPIDLEGMDINEDGTPNESETDE